MKIRYFPILLVIWYFEEILARIVFSRPCWDNLWGASLSDGFCTFLSTHDLGGFCYLIFPLASQRDAKRVKEREKKKLHHAYKDYYKYRGCAKRQRHVKDHRLLSSATCTHVYLSLYWHERRMKGEKSNRKEMTPTCHPGGQASLLTNSSCVSWTRDSGKRASLLLFRSARLRLFSLPSTRHSSFSLIDWRTKAIGPCSFYSHYEKL